MDFGFASLFPGKNNKNKEGHLQKNAQPPKVPKIHKVQIRPSDKPWVKELIWADKSRIARCYFGLVLIAVLQKDSKIISPGIQKDSFGIGQCCFLIENGDSRMI